MKIQLIVFFVAFFQYSFSQNKESENIDTPKFIATVEIDAIFPGGMEVFGKYVIRNIRLPEMESNTSGEIIMSYTVGKDGFLTDIKLVKNNLGKLGEEISIDAIRVLKSCPKWLPASKDGKHINWTRTIPLKISNI